MARWLGVWFSAVIAATVLYLLFGSHARDDLPDVRIRSVGWLLAMLMYDLALRNDLMGEFIRRLVVAFRCCRALKFTTTPSLSMHMSSAVVRRYDDSMVALMAGWSELRISPGLGVELVCGSLQPWPQPQHVGV